MHTVDQRIAGVQGQMAAPDGSCTLGYNVEREDDTAWYFASAAHSTLDVEDDWGAVRLDTIGQPTLPSEVIGVEIVDPETFTHAEDTKCPSGFDGRYTDVALYRHSSGIDFTHGVTARPNVGSTTYTAPRHIGGAWNPLQNDEVHMVGVASGRQTGDVLRTCQVVHGPTAADHRLVCAYVADYDRAGGDSGGPVVIDTPYAPHIAVRVHFGYNWADSTEAVFSPTDESRLIHDQHRGVTVVR